MNRRFSTLDGNPLNPQDPEGVPSHRCLILNQSFEALKSAGSSTEAMRKVQQEMERAVNKEGEKNEQYKQFASEYAGFSEHIDITAHGMNSLTNIPKVSINGEETEVSQDSGQKEGIGITKDET